MTAAEEEDFSPLRKWIIAITVMFGAFLAVMDISVVNVALPHLMGTFGQDLSSITWVATSYSIAEIILLTMAGWLTMLLGRKRLYLLSFAVFTSSRSLRPEIATAAPAAISPSARARPMPLPAPVTSARRPFRLTCSN